MNEKWNDNSIQYPRLLAEIRGKLCAECWDDIAEEMDLTTDELAELFDRAEADFTRIKKEL